MEKGAFPERDRALFLLGIRTGFRISEILSLRLCDVFQNGGYTDRISVARKHMKKKTEGRTVRLHSEALEALKTLVLTLKAQGKGEPKDFIFQSRKGTKKQLGRIAAWYLIQRAARTAGIAGKIGTHCMRKTFAKRIYERLGHDLLRTQKALGHAEIKSTMSYLTFSEDEIDDAILKD